MAKPDIFNGYDERQTLDCERVLVTLLRGLGPWKDSVYLIGGLTPRYLVDARPPDVPAHAGTQDVDIVIDLQILADTEAYHTLEQNLKKMGFERAENESGKKLSWRWQTKTETGVRMILELISEGAELGGGKVQALPTEKTISALNVPHASMVFDLYDVKEIQAELLGGNGVATEKVKYANLITFTCLKSFAFDHRNERKDAHGMSDVHYGKRSIGGEQMIYALGKGNWIAGANLKIPKLVGIIVLPDTTKHIRIQAHNLKVDASDLKATDGLLDTVTGFPK